MSAPDSPTPAAPNPWRYRIWVLSAMHCFGAMSWTAIGAMSPTLIGAFGLSATEFGFLISAYTGIQIIVAFPSGPLIDRFGIGRSIIFAQLLQLGGLLLIIHAGGYLALLPAMALLGLGYSFVNPATSKAVLEWYPRERRASAMGVKQAGVPIGGLLGAAGGATVVWLGWQGVMWVAVGCALLGLVAALPLIGEKTSTKPGSLKLMADLGQVLRDRNFGLYNGALGLYQTGQFGLFSYITLFLSEGLRTTQPVASAALGVAQGASFFGRLGWGWVSDRIFRGRRKPAMTIACVTAVIGFTLMAVAGFAGGEWAVVAAFVLAAVLGLSAAGHVALSQTIIIESIDPRLVATGAGYNRLYTGFGAMVGPPLCGFIIDETGEYGLAWAALALLALIATIVFVGWFREGREHSA